MDFEKFRYIKTINQNKFSIFYRRIFFTFSHLEINFSKTIQDLEPILPSF